MSPFSQSTLAHAERRLDRAIALLEEHADGGGPQLLGEAFGKLVEVRDALRGVVRLEERLEEMAEAEEPATQVRKAVSK